MTDTTHEPRECTCDVGSETAQMALDRQESSDQALLRREFFQRAAFASGGALVASIAANTAAGTAVEASCHAYFDVDQVYAKEEQKQYFKGYTLMMYVYGHFTCQVLFRKRLELLISKISKRVGCAVNALSNERLLTQENAAKIQEKLEIIMVRAPRATVRELYLLNSTNIAVGTLDQLLEICQQINQLGLVLPFAYPMPNDALGDAQATLDDQNSQAMLHPDVLGNRRLWDLYHDWHPQDPNHPHVVAITRAKKGFIFGPKPAAFANRSDFQAYVSTHSGVSKGNHRACDGGTCTDCKGDDASFCDLDATGHCTLISDPWTSECTRI